MLLVFNLIERRDGDVLQVVMLAVSSSSDVNVALDLEVETRGPIQQARPLDK